MRAFLCKTEPVSQNNTNTEHKTRYKEQLQEAYQQYYPGDVEQFKARLYGFVYYFFKRKPAVDDADNISKPVWDALQRLIYKNDKQIKIRYAGIVDLRLRGDFENARSF